METEMKPHQLDFISILAHNKLSVGKTGRLATGMSLFGLKVATDSKCLLFRINICQDCIPRRLLPSLAAISACHLACGVCSASLDRLKTKSRQNRPARVSNFINIGRRAHVRRRVARNQPNQCPDLVRGSMGTRSC